jgi:hypothetical protein
VAATPLTDIVYDYADAPTIKRFSEDRHFLRGLMGPFGSGKSSGCVIELIKIAAAQPVQADGKRRARFAVIRNTYPQLRDTTIRTFHDWLPPMFFGDWKASDHTYIVNKLAPDLEIEVWFRALDREEHVANLLSAEFTAAWVNEAREIPYAIIKALRGRVGRYPKVENGGCTYPCIIMDTNPPDDESWWYDLFEVRRPDNAAIFKQPSGRSPEAENKKHLPPNYYENMVADGDQDFVKVYVDGEYGYVREGKPVFPEYADLTHCKDIEPTPGVRIYRGWDFGLTPACVFAQVLPDGRFLVFDELTADSVGIDTFAETVLEHTAAKYGGWPVEDVGDPAGQARSAMAKPSEEQSCFEILHAKHIYIEPGEQTLTVRLGSVKKVLNTLLAGKPRFVLHSRCKVLRRGFQGRYQYKRIKIPGAEEKYSDLPDKNSFSHPMDALEYITGKLFGLDLKSPQNAASNAGRYQRRVRSGKIWMSL